MKKIVFLLCAFFLTASLSYAQQDEKQKTKNKKYNNNWNYNNGWGGKRVVGEGGIVKIDRDIKNFTGVTSGISANVYIKQSSNFKVTLEGQKNIIDLVTTDVVNGKLKISFEKGYSINSSEPLNVYVEAPNFEFLGMSGSGDVKAENALKGSDLEISISGSGNFQLSEISFASVKFGISGSGDVRVGGSSESVAFYVSGSGNINASKLKTQKAVCHVSGSGDITCNAQQALEAHVSGSGDIKYIGKPESLKTRVSGSGDIRSVD